MTEQEQWEAGVNTHEDTIFSCFGGLSSTGITSALASLEAVKELGLDKVAVGCLAGLPVKIAPVLGTTRAAKKTITLDACPQECAGNIAEQAGIKVSKSIVLARDIKMKKKPLNEDIGGDLKGVMEYVSLDEVQRAKDLIVKAVLEE